MTPFVDFVVNGKIGRLSLGISKHETLSLLGHPKDWLGRSTLIGKHCASYRESDLWFYYEGSAGIRFAERGAASGIWIYPENAEKCPELFKTWPPMKNLKMGEWRAALKADNIPFREPDTKALDYWIVAGGTCVAYGFPLEARKTLRSCHDRRVEILAKFLSVQDMQRECSFVVEK